MGFEKVDTVAAEMPVTSMEVNRWGLNALSKTVLPCDQKQGAGAESHFLN